MLRGITKCSDHLKTIVEKWGDKEASSRLERFKDDIKAAQGADQDMLELDIELQANEVVGTLLELLQEIKKLITNVD